MHEYKISMIIPIYNSGEYLENTINNVINQSIGFENIELFLIDDCSTDNSKNIIKKYSSQYDNIKPIFFEKNSGHPSYPRNAALKEVTAPYIIFLDSDDELYDDYCEVMYDLINANDVDIVNCNHTSKINDELYIPTDIEDINHSTAILNDDEKLFINPTVWGNIFRTSFLERTTLTFYIFYSRIWYSQYSVL